MKRNDKDKTSTAEKQDEEPELTDAEMDYLSIVAEEIRSRASIQQAVADLSEICWNKCISKPPGSYLSTNEQKCLQYCVYRYVETSNFILLRLHQIAARINATMGGGEPSSSPPPPPPSSTEINDVDNKDA
jgi:import inner membrane translocase subunit TIM8